MRLLKGLTLVAAIAGLCGSQARASVVVDAFTVAQTTTLVGTGSNTTTASGASILGGTRTQTVFLDRLPPFAVGVAVSGNPSGVFTGSFTGPNSPVGGSFFDLSYATSAINVTALNGIAFTASSQGGSTLTITANGSSSVAVTIPDSPGFNSYFISFASFSDSTVFSALTSLDFKATFPNVTGSGPSITFSGPILIGASVPEPSILALGSAAALILGGFRLRRKS